ncbi:MAG: hypothetical protein ACI9WU_004546 [Myxococcota bacterium]|jgi:hypothetical protein
MAEVDELTVAFEDNGQEVVKELDKEILSKGSWTTIAFLYQDWDNKVDGFGKHKMTLRRYQKQQGNYRQKSKFNISSIKQARKIHEVLTRWLEKYGGDE